MKNKNFKRSWNDKRKKVLSSILGFNYRMTAMQAAIGIVQLKKLKDILKKKLIKNNYILHLKAKTLKYFQKSKTHYQ